MFLLASRTRPLTVMAILLGIISVALFGAASVFADHATASNRVNDPRIAAESRPASEPAPLFRVKDTTRLIPGQYIIVYKFNQGLTAPDSESLVNGVGGTLQFTYQNVFEGFAADNLNDAAIATLQSNSNVAYIQQSQRITLIDEPSLGAEQLYLPLIQGRIGNSVPPTATPPGSTPTATRTPGATSTPPTGSTPPIQSQMGATWGLDRSDQRAEMLNLQYTYSYTGQGVHMFVIDTGLRATHQDFTRRVGAGFDAVGEGSTNDCQGHGTHVAGTTGGTEYGIAKGVTIHPVRVLNCDGYGDTATVVAGMDWVIQNHQAPSVANMSLGGEVDAAIDTAIQSLIDSGITVVVAAGNEDQDACTRSPARAPNAITVGASNKYDMRADFSNWGTCVDLFAPGEEIFSAGIDSDDAVDIKSGTSMAAPHVAGLAALVLQKYPTYTNAQVTQFILQNTTPNMIADVKGSPNLLMFSPFGDPEAQPPTPTPVTPTATPPPGTSADYTGTLTGMFDENYRPNEAGIAVTISGPMIAHLSGPTSTDFDLYLEQLSGSEWIVVDSSIQYDSDETIEYDAAPGTYRWKITSLMGSGDYTLHVQYPYGALPIAQR